jgi:sugar lactone lactonase YvrE
LRATPEPLLDERFEHPEGLVWDERGQRLLWVDVFQGRVHASDLGGGPAQTVAELGGVIGAVAPRAAGGLVCAVGAGFGLLSGEGELELVQAPLADSSHLQMNDGAVDASGRFWAGSMTFEFEAKPGTGALYRFDPDGELHEVLGGVSISNGIGWSPDSKLLYYVDSATQGLDRFSFDLDSGAISERRTLARFEALPDGLAVDAEGCVWVALFGGSSVARVTPEGAVDRVVELPATQVTTCAFGGPHLETLFIAVSPYGLDADAPDARAAGQIFRYEAGVRGLPSTEFAG